MTVDFKAVVAGLGGSVSEKRVTELYFGPGRRLILEELADLTEKEAMKRILEIAFPSPPAGTVFRNAGGTYQS